MTAKVKQRIWLGFGIFAALVLLGPPTCGIIMDPPLADRPSKLSERERLLAEYEAQKGSLLSELDELILKKDWTRALYRASPYRDLDIPDLLLRYNKAREMQLIDQVRDVPASNLEVNLAAYDELSRLNPLESRYQERKDYYQSKLDEQRREAAVFVRQYGPPPKRSGFSGSNEIVEGHLKTVVRNPDSLKMEKCSDAYRSADGWIMLCGYHAQNGFGGMNRETKWFVVRNERVVAIRDAGYYTIK